jgi:hypothetical protein
MFTSPINDRGASLHKIKFMLSFRQSFSNQLRSFLKYFRRNRNLVKYLLPVPVPMTTQSKARPVFDFSNSGNVNSIPARGMDMCVCVCARARFSASCCPVKVEALRRADLPSKESDQIHKKFMSFRKLNSESQQAMMV